MKANAIGISLILLLLPLAGCSGSDTDVVVDMDSEDLQGIIDDNRDDFLNNTTVVVFQEYHNNTTIINQYSNNTTTNLDNSGTSSSTTTYNYNGTSSDSGIHVIRIEWNASDMFPGMTPKWENQFTTLYSYFDYPTNSDRTDEFTLDCSYYYDAPIPGENYTADPFWFHYNDDHYYDWWDSIVNSTIRDLLEYVSGEQAVTIPCRESENLLLEADYRVDYGTNWYEYYYDFSGAYVFLELLLENGTAIDVLEINAAHRYTSPGSGYARTTGMTWTVNGHWQGPNDSNYNSDYCPIKNWYDDSESCRDYYGGWEDLPLTFQMTGNVYQDSEFTFTMYYEILPVSN